MNRDPGRVSPDPLPALPHHLPAAAQSAEHPLGADVAPAEAAVAPAAGDRPTPSLVLYASKPITVTADSVGVCIVLVGDIDINYRQLIREGANAAIHAQRPVLIDAQQVTFMDSSTLGLFVILVRSGQPVTVTDYQPTCARC